MKQVAPIGEPSPRSAILFLIGIVAALQACGGDGDGSLGPDPDEMAPVGSIEVTPSAGTLEAVEATLTLSATVHSAEGAVVSRSVDWASANPAVASVSDGVVTARRNGSVDVVASVEDVADTARITVAQLIDTVTVTPDSLELFTGQSGQLEVEPIDPNAHPVPGVVFTWSSSDASVASVDDTGRVTGETEGTAMIVATSVEDSELSASAPVVVTAVDGPSDAPAITSAGPLHEGEQATLEGTNFHPIESENTVTLDGVALDVVDAAEDALTVDVPGLGCLPAREGTLAVTTTMGADSTSVDVVPDEPTVELSVGEQMVRTDPGQFCLQFSEDATSGRYLVGLQSLSGVFGSLTAYRAVAEAVDEQGDAARASLASDVTADAVGSRRTLLRGDDALPTGSSLQETPHLDDRVLRHRIAEQRLRAWERARFDGRRSDLHHGGTQDDERLQLAVGAGASVGDTIQLRVPDLRADNVCSDWLPVEATIRAIGDRTYVVGDVDNPAGGLTTADYEDLANRIDDDIFDTQTAYFGDPTDIDTNDRIVALYSKEVNRASDVALGFAFAGDLFPRSGTGTTCASSDEGELFYARAPDPDGTFGPAFAREDALAVAPTLLAHELTHVIQQSRRVADGTTFMSSIIAEAQANLSEEIVGHAVTGRAPGQNLGIDAAFNPDSVDEVDWYRDAFVDLAVYFGFDSETSRIEDAPEACGWWRQNAEPCAGRPLWYGVGWSFLRWISDHHGPSFAGGEGGLHRALIDNGESGLANVVDVVGEPLDGLMAQWAAALYVDDRVPGADPRLTFPSWNFEDIFSNLVETARLEPLPTDFSDWSVDGDIRASSTSYFLLNGSSGSATAVRMTGSSGGQLPGYMQLWVVRLE